jgi:DNA polymerase-3 subunit epsilon
MFATMPDVPLAADLATPLHAVTFCVVDLETTGASPADCTITEVGAARFRGGECLGTFQTLVNPGSPIPPFITQLTGITEAMVLPAPPVREILPALLEFVGGAVLVGHNVRFDLSFLDAALTSLDRERIGLPSVDTVALARRLLLDDDVADCRLGTLAARFGLSHRPTHRALDDVLATADLLHLLLEQAAPLGVTELDDLLALPAVARPPHAAKLPLTARLPRAPGVYLFRDGQGRPLYAGSAEDLRTRVRSLFAVRAGPRLRTLGPVLRGAHGLDHLVCSSPFEAAVAATRVVHALEPRFNVSSGRWRGYRYVRPGGARGAPRAAVARVLPPAGRATAGWLGPMPSTAAARRVAAAVTAVGEAVGDGPAALAERMRRATGGDEDALLAPLRARSRFLADAGRDVEAAAMAEHVAALGRALQRHARLDAVRRIDRVVVDLPDCTGAEIVRGRLARAWSRSDAGDRRGRGVSRGAADVVGGGLGRRGGEECVELARVAAVDPDSLVLPPHPRDGPIPVELVDEVACVVRWLARCAPQVLAASTGDGARGRPREVDRGPRSPGLRCLAC